MSRPATIAYRPDIDTLRGLALVLVMAFHAYPARVPGGFLSLDVFFVISGFIITQLILAEHAEDQFKFANFYERRVRRILPGMMFMLLGTVPLVWFSTTTAELKQYAHQLLASLVMAANFVLAPQRGYFAADAQDSILFHLWSLGVEEQFYLVFPAILVGALALRRKLGAHLPLVVLFILWAASFGLCVVYGFKGASWPYFMLPTRFWELATGAITAFAAPAFVRRFSNPLLATGLALAALGVMAISMLKSGLEVGHPGLPTLPMILSVATLILATPSSPPVRWLLSVPPGPFIGRISYGGYLWHVPIFYAYRCFAYDHSGISHGKMGHSWVIMALMLASLVMGWISMVLIERPFRNPRRMPRRSLALILSVAIGLLAAGAGLMLGHDPRRLDDGGRLNSLDRRMGPVEGLGRIVKCPLESDLYGQTCANGPDPTVAVIGDSHAMHVVPGILASNPNVQLLQITMPECGFLQGRFIGSSEGPARQRFRELCGAKQHQILRKIAQTPSIKYVVLGWGARAYYPWLEVGTPQQKQRVDALIADVRQYGQKIRDMGKTPVLFISPPEPSARWEGICSVYALIQRQPETRCDWPADRNWGRKIAADFTDRLTLESGMRTINPVRDICHDGMCSVIKDGVIIMRDPGHFSWEGSAWLGKRQDWYGQITGQGPMSGLEPIVERIQAPPY